MKLLKRGRFESIRKNLAVVAIQAEILLLLRLLGHADYSALCCLLKISINGVHTWFEIDCSLRATLSKNQMAVRKPQAVLLGRAPSLDNHTDGANNVRNGTIAKRPDLSKAAVLNLVISDDSVSVEAWRSSSC